MCLKIAIFSVLLMKAVSEGANILAVSTVISPSHYIFDSSLLLSLAERGHNVTFLTHDADRFKHPNFTHIYMEGGYEAFYAQNDIFDIVGIGAWTSINELWSFSNSLCEHDFTTKGLKQLLDYPKDYKFDLIIWDILLGQCLYPLIDRFGNPPVVALTAFLMQPNVYGNVVQSYDPFYLMRITDHMRFLERIENNFWQAAMALSRKYLYLPAQTKLAKSHFGEDIVPLQEVEREMSLFLVNHNPAFNFPLAFPPNVVPVGGLQIKSKPLTKDFKKILDDAKDGAIIFSLGTNMKSALLGQERIKALLNAFGRLKETVIWKFEDETLTNVPKNVIIKKWLPQSDLLGHPNVKLLVIHGGMLSSHEGVYHGLPMIIIPFFYDQLQNVHNLVGKGVAVELDFRKLDDVDLVHGTITKVITDASYSRNAKRLSELYRDQPQKPMERAIYWIEYLLRYGTASHLDIASRDMNFIQIANIDLFLVAFSVPICILISLIYIVRKICSKMCNRSVSKVDSLKKNK